MNARITGSRVKPGGADSMDSTYHMIEFIDHIGQLQKNKVGGYA